MDSITQRETALAHANVVRIAASDLRGKLQRGDVTPHELLAAPAPPFDRWCAIDLLRQCPGIGSARLELFGWQAIHHGVNAAMPLGFMQPAHRDWIARWIDQARSTATWAMTVAVPAPSAVAS